MKSRANLLIAFFSAMAVSLVAVSRAGRTSPGELSAVHGRIEGLEGRNDCSSCHGGMFGTLREACLECHGAIESQLAAGEGLHSTLGARAEQCGLCHAEHHGRGAPLVHGQSFALAGVPDVEEFDHALVGFPMSGVHLEQDCGVCHENWRAPILAAGEHRFLGLDMDCATCHEDPHSGLYAASCSACHGQETWDGLDSLGHERFLALTGGHADLACDACHDDFGEHALAVVGGPAHRRPAARDCTSCHESPHRDGFTRGAAALAQLAPGAGCVTCHEPEHTTFGEDALSELAPELHAPSGFPLSAPHDDVACELCHDPSGSFDARFPGRSAAECSVCHEDVHAGQFDTGAFAGKECSTCHERTFFEPHAFTARQHALTALPLEGAHLDAGCEQCHEKPFTDAPRVFHGTPADCDDCHSDAHEGFFADFLRTTRPPEHGQCALCHDAASFSGAADDFEHGAATGFPVDGAHAQADCAACHAAGPAPDAHGRTFGRVAELFGDFEGCETCHVDPHDGRFDASLGLPSMVEARGDCARCHVTSSFRLMAREFDHGFWTTFALAGPHAEARCTACHEPLAGADDTGRTTGLALGPDCADCHANPHGSQFAGLDDETDCARCHDSRRSDLLSFDHEHDARFALGDAHRDLACSACHGLTQEGGRSFVHYRPLGRDCTDCHGGNPEVPLRRQPRNR